MAAPPANVAAGHADIAAGRHGALTCATYETYSRLYIMPGFGMKRLDRLQRAMYRC